MVIRVFLLQYFTRKAGDRGGARQERRIALDRRRGYPQDNARPDRGEHNPISINDNPSRWNASQRSGSIPFRRLKQFLTHGDLEVPESRQQQDTSQNR